MACCLQPTTITYGSWMSSLTYQACRVPQDRGARAHTASAASSIDESEPRVVPDPALVELLQHVCGRFPSAPVDLARRWAFVWAQRVMVRGGCGSIKELVDAETCKGEEWSFFIDALTELSVPKSAQLVVVEAACEAIRCATASPPPQPLCKSISQPTPRATREYVLENSMTDLARVEAMLKTTIEEVAVAFDRQAAKCPGYDCAKHWKERTGLSHSPWNYCKASHLDQLLAIVQRLRHANGAFVPLPEIRAIAYAIDPEAGHVKSSDASSARFRAWVLRYLHPAVQYYKHEQGATGHVQSRVYFYACPVTASAAANVRDSFDSIVRGMEERTVETRLARIPVREYLGHLPSRATQRVLRSLLAALNLSSNFAENRLGLSALSLCRAKSKMDLALLMSCELERKSYEVRSDMTAERQHRRRLVSVCELRAEQLHDEHAGGVTEKAEQCRQAGLRLKQLIEDAAEKLGEYNYDEALASAISGSADVGGSAPVSKRRDSEVQLRSENATWGNIAEIVKARVRQHDPSFTISEAQVRVSCIPRAPNTREGRRHAAGSAAAQVSCSKLTAMDEEWNVDGHECNADVAMVESQFASVLADGRCAAMLLWDDHSTIEADKRRGWTSRATVLHRSKLKTAPYSDMGKTLELGGAKVTANSMLFHLPLAADPSPAAAKQTSASKRDADVLIHKQAFVVTRLQHERRSTPIQQFNDLRFVAHTTPWLQDFLLSCPILYALSDAGWDHCPRCPEVKWANTLHHLEYDRDQDTHITRSKGQSGRSEAERVQSVLTGGLTRGSVASTVRELNKPSSAEELTSNRRKFLHAVYSACCGVLYAGMRVIVRRSYPGCEQTASESHQGTTSSPAVTGPPTGSAGLSSEPATPPPPISDFMSQELRLAVRKVMDSAPSKRAGLPHHALFANVDRYHELHSTSFHYQHHLLRHDCKRSLGRLCCPSDYPFPQQLQFCTCSIRPLRDPKVRLPPPSVRDPSDAHHHLTFEQVEAMVANGTINLYATRQPFSQQLKAWSKVRSGLLSPSAAEVKVLTSQMLPPEPSYEASEEMRKNVERWFEDKRMQRYLKAEAEQAALANNDTLVHARAVAVRLLHEASGKVDGIATPFGRADSAALLNDARIGLSPLGSNKVLLERIYEHREHIIRMLSLQSSKIEQTPSAAEIGNDADDDPLLCKVCDGDASPDRPILKCDGAHSIEVGYHLDCLPPERRPEVMPGDNETWLCPECCDKGLYVVAEIRDKKTKQLEGGRPGQRAVHFLCHWCGYDSDADTWEPLCNIPSQARHMVTAFNSSLRKRKPVPN